MAFEDWISVISVGISVVGIIVSILIENKIRKDDKVDFENQLKLEKQKLERYEEQLQLKKTPTPVLSISRAEVYTFKGEKYLHTSIEINNTGKDALALKNAILIIDCPTYKASGAISYAKIDNPMVVKYLLQIKQDVPSLIMEKLNSGEFDVINQHKNRDLLSEDFLEMTRFHSIDVLEEYLEDKGHKISNNEHLKSENVKHLTKPGFYRITLLIEPSHKEMNFYSTSRIVFVPAFR